MDEYTNQPQQGSYQPQQETYQPQQQAPYQQPYPQQPVYDPTTEVMTVGQYIGVLILTAIPVVNLICWIVWLCSKNTNKNKKNFVIANIVVSVIIYVILLLVVLLGSAAGIATTGMLM